jgi:hypothetical protein
VKPPTIYHGMGRPPAPRVRIEPRNRTFGSERRGSPLELLPAARRRPSDYQVPCTTPHRRSACSPSSRPSGEQLRLKSNGRYLKRKKSGIGRLKRIKSKPLLRLIKSQSAIVLYVPTSQIHGYWQAMACPRAARKSATYRSPRSPSIGSPGAVGRHNDASN